MLLETDGLVIREKPVGESDRLVTILTRHDGVVRAFARHAKRFKDKKNPGTGLLCYSRFVIFRGRENNQINEAQVQEVFFGLRGEIEALSLAQYFCELAEVVAPEGTESEEYLRLLLNALYFLSRKARPRLLLKAITEMRLLALSGYMPDLVGCRRCGTYESPRMAFLPRSGQICCERCFHTPEEGKEPAVWLPPGAMMGLRHTIYAEFQKLFAFTLPPEEQKQLSKAAEQYMFQVMQRSFDTLQFYHTVAGEEG